jgi:hypothetical protein
MTMTKEQKTIFRNILNSIRLAKTQTGAKRLETLNRIEAQLKSLLPKDVPQSRIRAPTINNYLGKGMMYISNRFR